MAFNDVPLNDAGRDYYNRQFGDRVQNIRKYGAAPPTARGSGCLGTGGAAGGGIFAIIVVIRIIAAVAWVGSSNYDSSYNNYNSYEAPNVTIPDPPPADFRDQFHADPPFDPNGFNPNPGLGQPDQPIFVPPFDPPVVQPDDPLVRPDPPAVPVPDPNPPAVPGDDKPDGDK